jgi:hypothetical protein
MQKMLDELSKFSISHEIKFNPTKTNVMVFNSNEDTSSLRLCEQAIVNTNQIKYLGIDLSSNYSNVAHIERRKKAVANSIANLTTAGIFNSKLSTQTKLRLYITYLKPLIAYGSEIINYNENELKEMKKLDGNTLKKIIGLSKNCVSTPLYNALGADTTRESIYKQQLKFINRAQQNLFVQKFIIETRKINNFSGVIGHLNKVIGSDNHQPIELFNVSIGNKLNTMERTRRDKYKFNVEAQEIKKVLLIRNSYLRRMRLNDKLYHMNYYKEQK